MDELKAQLAALELALKTHFEKATEEQKLSGSVQAETVKTMANIQKQLDAVELKLADAARLTPTAEKTLADTLKENEDVSRLLHNRKGHAIVSLKGAQVAQLMGQKTTITLGNIGPVATPGVVSIERMVPIVEEARQTLRMRDVLSSRPTEAGLIYFVKVNAPLVNASPQVEAQAKFENALTFTTASERVKVIATWIPMSRQALDDFTELEGFLRASLPYYVNKEEERQLLIGDGTGENLNGLVTQATAFNPALLESSYTRIDQIGAAIEQVEIANEIEPTFVTLNPRDWWKLRRTKDGFGRYILGDPQSKGNPNIWDLSVVSTNSMAPGSFVVGSGQAAAAEIRDRMEMQVEISTEHQDFFTKNLVAIRAEKRLALVVMRPASFITGTFATSPA